MCKIGASSDRAYIPNCQGRERHNDGALEYTQCSFFNFLCELDLFRIGAGAVEVLIEEGVGIILDNVVDLTLDKSKTQVDGV